MILIIKNASKIGIKRILGEDLTIVCFENNLVGGIFIIFHSTWYPYLFLSVRHWTLPIHD